VGGKTGPASGSPLDLEVTVRAINAHARQIAQGESTALGLTVAVEVQGVQIVLNSLRQQVFSPECFTEVGINPQDQRVLIVKSTQHFTETFAALAAEILYATAPAGTPVDYRSFAYRNLCRPVWPLDPPPFEAFGNRWH
jgi:microcystin degradation protein MlrC